MSTFKTQYIDKEKHLKMDQQSGFIYLGYAEVGTGDDSPTWSIKRIQTNPLEISHAEGNTTFDKIWANRLSYTYS